MTIVVGTPNSAISDAGASGQTVSVNVGSATHRGLALFVVHSGNAVASLTYAGADATTGAVAGASGTTAKAYFIVPSATGANDAVLTMTGATNCGLFCVPLSADGAMSADDGDSVNSTGSPLSLTILSAIGRLVLDAFFLSHTGGGSTTTVGAGQTARADHESYNGANSAGCSSEAGGASTVMSWTATNAGGYVQVGFSVVEAPTATGSRKIQRIMRG